MVSLTGMNSNPALSENTFAPHRMAGERATLIDSIRSRITWARVGLAALLLVTAGAYIWNLSASGYANSFYAAAVQAGTRSWKALFFGSIDSSNFITVDKPPASLWVMALSGRIFGFSSWSMLVPQALEGVGAVWLLYAAIKRWFGAGAGLAAGAMLAFTPVAALMFRFNNPDALLVLMLTAGAYCLTRAIERAGTRWIVAAGAMIGIAFLAKMLQAFLVLPAFSLVYLIAAPTGIWRRTWQLLAGAAAMLLTAGWWVAAVALWPVGSRPFIDGSPDNSIFNLITGYNGLERLFSSGGPGGGGAGGGMFSGSPGLLRLFNDLMGGQASWLLPAAVLALALGLWSRRRAPRTDRVRAALLLWGGWLLVTAVVFSFGRGVIHTYYTVALAPAIAALVAIGGALLWQRRESAQTRALAALAIGVSCGWAFALLSRTPSWLPWLRVAIAIAGALAIIGLLIAPLLSRPARRLTLAAAVLAVIAIAAGPLAYSVETISTPHTGSIPSAGPALAASVGGGPFGGGPAGGGPAGGGPAGGGPAGGGPPGGATRGGGTPRGFPGAGAIPSATGAPGAGPGSGGARGGFTAGGGAGGGPSALDHELLAALERDSSDYRWVAATFGSQTAASIELATGGDPVMAIGGFNNNGGNLSLSAFQHYVADGDIHYFIDSGGGGGGGGPSGAAGDSSGIAAWVKAHFKSIKIGDQTVYDLTQPINS